MLYLRYKIKFVVGTTRPLAEEYFGTDDLNFTTSHQTARDATIDIAR